MRLAILLALLLTMPLLMANTCGDMNSATTAPEDQGHARAPEDPAPTGTRWVEVPVDGGCGRYRVAWILLDEACGSLGSESYYEAFQAPMFRDGALVGNTMYAVDATHVWALDVSDPDAIERRALVSGLGQPLAAATHDGDLILAGAQEGLIIADLSDPSRPARRAEVRVPGAAMDVVIRGHDAYVAAGEGGWYSVDLSGDQPGLEAGGPVEGNPVGITVDQDFIYLAACDRLVIVDTATGTTAGSVWLDSPYEGNYLVAPAKDVEVVGNVAFVAAGRYGVVAVDVTNPAEPLVIGNCAISDDLSFYASGVRAEGDTLYVAGGEWGIMTLDVANPAATCVGENVPQLFETDPQKGGECNAVPTYVELPPPPRAGQDPLQVLPTATRLYAFGDASRVGLRALDVYSLDIDMRVGRFEEPRVIAGIAAGRGRVIGVATPSLLLREDPSELLVMDELLPLNVEGAAFLADGRWIIGLGGELRLETGEAWSVGAQFFAKGLVAHGDAVAVPKKNGVLHLSVTAEALQFFDSARDALMAPTTALSDAGLFFASAEWERAERLDAAGATALSPHGVFAAADILNPDMWRQSSPERVLVGTSRGLLEVASYARQAGAVLHGAGGSQTTPLPAGDYVGGMAAKSTVYLVAANRGTYRSNIVSLVMGDDGPEVSRIDSFTGVAVGVAADTERLYVADADSGIRIYAVDGGTPVGLGHFPMGDPQ